MPTVSTLRNEETPYNTVDEPTAEKPSVDSGHRTSPQPSWAANPGQDAESAASSADLPRDAAVHGYQAARQRTSMDRPSDTTPVTLRDERGSGARSVSWRDLPRKDQLIAITLTRLSEPLVQTSLQVGLPAPPPSSSVSHLANYSTHDGLRSLTCSTNSSGLTRLFRIRSSPARPVFSMPALLPLNFSLPCFGDALPTPADSGERRWCWSALQVP